MSYKQPVKRLLSGTLAAAMILTAMQAFPLAANAEDADPLTTTIGSTVQAKIGDQTYTLSLYGDNLYEVKLSDLKAGKYEASLYIDGKDTGKSETIDATKDGDVYLQYDNAILSGETGQKHAFQDSYDEGVLHTEVVTGSINQLSAYHDEKHEKAMMKAEWAVNGTGENPNTDAVMDYVGGGTYRETFYLEAPTEDIDLEYKVAEDNSWDNPAYGAADGGGNTYGKNTGNLKVTIPAGTEKWEVLLNTRNQKLYDSTTAGQITPVQSSGNQESYDKMGFQVALIGSARETSDGKDWDNRQESNAGFTFTQVTPDVYAYTKVFAKAGSYDYKCVFNNSKWYENCTGNLKVTTEMDNQAVTFVYDATTDKLLDNVSGKDEVARLLDYESTAAATPSEDSEASQTAGTSVNVQSTVFVNDGNSDRILHQYQKGLYEAKLKLKAGETTLVAKVDGALTEVSDTITLDSDQEVWVRYQDGKLYDSVNHAGQIYHTETLVGGFGKDKGAPITVKLGDTDYPIQGWKQDDTNMHLHYVGGGIYERTFQIKAPESDVTVADGGYKIAEDDKWDVSYGEKGNNKALTIPAGSTELTIRVNTIDGQILDSINDKDALSTKVQIIGSARNNEKDKWSTGAEGYEFTQLNDHLYIYSDVYEGGKTEYKLLVKGDWYVDNPSGDNLSYTLPTGAKKMVTYLYDATTHDIMDSENDQAALAKALGTKAAEIVAAVEENVNHTYHFIQPLKNDKAEVKLVYGTYDEKKQSLGELTSVNLTKTADAYEANNVYFGDEEKTILYQITVDGTAMDYSNTEGAVTLGNQTYARLDLHKYEGRVVNVPGTFPGPSWDPGSNQMTYMGNQRYAYTFKNVPAANYEYKIALAGSWDENYGAKAQAGGANNKVAVPDTQDVTVLYNDISHLMVTSVDYMVADISLSGAFIPEGTKLTDDFLRGIYSASVTLPAGSYKNIEATYDGKKYLYNEFTLNEEKTVNFYFDPTSLVYYDDASDKKVETKSIKYDTESSDNKSIWGAVPTNQDVTFALETGTDVSNVRMIVKGNPDDQKNLELTKDGDAANGIQRWAVTTNFTKIGELTYYFVISNGSDVITYGDDDGYYGTGKTAALTDVAPYDLVVYQDGYQTPDWMKNAVIYQIFPDRFANGDTKNDFNEAVKDPHTSRGSSDYELIDDWYTLPENPEQEGRVDEETYKKTGAYFGDQIWNNEIYGGDVQGIIDNMDYLKALGINVIYLNPSFASISSHRYDTSDYSKLDPILGDMGDFDELVRVAKENGMHIILDGVFNHVSDDSIYFDRYYKYLQGGESVNHGKIGAYPYWAYVYDLMDEANVDQAQAEKSAKDYFTSKYGITDYSYTTWFDVTKTKLKENDGTVAVPDTIGLRVGKPVYGYEGWWGYSNMPVIKATNGSEYQTESWAKEIIGNDDADNGSIAQYWISKGTSGWRLDVANEVSDETWQHFRKSVKALNDGEGVIIGEIWTDATKYLLGDMYDSVMNYMFRGYATNFAMGTKDATTTMKEMRKLRERYPKEAFYAMMNLVDSHDTTRILSYLDGIGDDRNDKEIASAFPTYEGTSDTAKSRQYLVALMQFTYAGAPTIYYGDELGMVGADDPDDRRAMEWGRGNEELTKWYARLAAIRAQYSALRTGSVEEFDTGNDKVLGYVRRDDDHTMIVLLNQGNEDQTVTLDLTKLNLPAASLHDILNGKDVAVVDGNASQNEIVRSLNANGLPVNGVKLGQIKVGVPSLRGAILTENPLEETALDTSALSKAWDSKYQVAAVDHAVLKKQLEEEAQNGDKPAPTVNDDKNKGQNSGFAEVLAESRDQAKTDSTKKATKSPKTGDIPQTPYLPLIMVLACGCVLGLAGERYFMKKEKKEEE